MLQYEPQNPEEVESEESKPARARGQSLADKSYAGREAQYFDGIKKLAAKFNRATVLVLKHTDALIINLDMHQFLNSDPRYIMLDFFSVLGIIYLIPKFFIRYNMPNTKFFY